MRIVADTNVIISALVFGGLPRYIFELVEAGRLDFFYSLDIQSEAQRVLRDKFEWNEAQLRRYLGRFWTLGLMVTPRVRIQVIADDPDDDRVLECALEANAHVLVSGDKHLLRLGQHEAIRILTPRELLDSYFRR
jgi:putative PIN family toxin of toxin-antitoxin system